MRRTKAEAAKTRQHILDAALYLFDDRGYSQTSLGAIAARAKVTRGAVYGHFANKEDILAALADSQFAWIIEQNALAIAAPGISQALSDNFVAFFHQLGESPQRLRFFRILHQEKSSNDPLGQLRKRYDALWQEQCRAAVAYGKSSGEIAADADPEYLHFHLSALLCGLIELYLENPDNPHYPEYTARAIKNTMHTLLHT